VSETIRSSLTGGLNVELLKHLDGERQVSRREQFVGADRLLLLDGVARDRVQQDVRVSEPHASGVCVSIETVAAAEARYLILNASLLSLEPGELGVSRRLETSPHG
jgi:hypothetical protein